jgi:uncharacterized protein YcaQ
VRTLTPTLARRLAITRQRLAGPPPPAPDAGGILDVVRDLGCLQLDPIAVVARSHQLVLWSRLGAYDMDDLDTLLWRERRLFEYWAHCASIVLTEDYPIHQVQMRKSRTGSSNWATRVRDWIAANQELHDYILEELCTKGPRMSSQFEDQAEEHWESSGWTAGRNVSRMLDFLWIRGQITVAGRSGIQKVWDLTERHLPDAITLPELPEQEAVRQAVQKSLRALGVGRRADINLHYTRGSYPRLPAVLAELEADGRIAQVAIRDGDRTWPGPWYIHVDDLPLLDRLAAGDWTPRTTLLSPFDNLICDRARTELLFDFNFRIEIYVPQAKRQYGYYVLPILHGDRLIGRIDPRMDRKQGRLVVNAVYAEPDAPMTDATARAVAGAVGDLAAFLGAKNITYTERVPDGWRSALN